jgi:hypothetical protein
VYEAGEEFVHMQRLSLGREIDGWGEGLGGVGLSAGEWSMERGLIDTYLDFSEEMEWNE